MTPITEFEAQVLALVDHYGGSRVDLSGTRFNADAQAAARECLRKGLLCGEPSALDITEAGEAAMKSEAAMRWTREQFLERAALTSAALIPPTICSVSLCRTEYDPCLPCAPNAR